MPIPPSNSRINHYKKDIATSMEGILEGISVENSEAIGSTTCETALILIKAYEQNLFLLSCCWDTRHIISILKYY